VTTDQALPREYAESVDVQVSPEGLYALVADVTRTGEWSPVCTSCWWDEDGQVPPGEVGSWFTGRNEVPGRTWETRSQVVAAEPGRAFGFEVGRGYVRWHYAFTPIADGTRLTEFWEFLPAGIAMFHERYGAEAEAQIRDRTEQALAGIPATLATIKQIAEGRPPGR
jgi:hypothetical protein